MDAKQLNALVHDREAALYDDRFQIRFDGHAGRRVARDLRRLAPDLPSVDRALDVACGTGYLAAGLAQAGLAREVHACDLSARMIERARANAERARIDVRLSRCDAEALPYRDGTFDLVCARGALHHLPSPLDALREMRRVLAPGGTAIVLAEPTPAGERQVGAVVGVAVGLVDAARVIARRPRDAEDHMWELASIAANLHTFEPDHIEQLAIKAGFEDITVGTASWAWVLALGVNYYLAGELGALATNPVSRLAGRTLVDVADTFDRVVGDALIPARFRHTVHAVLR